MARTLMRRTVAMAAAAFLVSTSAGAMASETTPSSDPASGSGASASSTGTAPSKTDSTPSPASTKPEAKPDPSPEPAPEPKAAPEPSAAAKVDATTEPVAAAVAATGTPDATASTVTGNDAASAPVTVPPGLDDGRLFPNMTNTPDGVGVLVGGTSDPGRGQNANDTWIFKDGTWLPVCGTTVAGADAPCALPARSAGALGTSPGGVIMFGGHPGALFNPTGASTSDTWRFDGTSWQQVCADGACGPPARSLAASAGNAAMTLMFGGLTNNLSTALEDTWAFDGTKWTQLCGISMGQPCGPSARFWSSMSWDGTRFVLFGGMEGDFATGAKAVGDTWIWTGSSWQLVCATGACGPGPRANAGFPTLSSPDPALAGSLLAGGLDLTFGREGTSTAFRDLWFWSAQSLTWRQLTSPWGPNVSWTGDGAPPADGLPLAFMGAATNDCQVVFYGSILGDQGNGVANTSTLVGWDNGAGQPATCAEQTPAQGHGERNAVLAFFQQEGGLPLTGGSPWAQMSVGGLLALVGLCLVLACRRRTLRAAGV